ncbi:H-NS histone family protein [Achromobacter mucicolens]|uniref:H-NS histone family protein n=1 Tax=Achromobacter mucicolens TaxID=1389922 RepID=A0ABD4Z0I7_9BURK|nr:MULTISPECIES: H-NS histone family protein [Achromobacter]MDG9971593.1 H-NS histone family protein [Achromobacter mucicolens]MDH1181272.1 H-NS histone family protein [Achromobacter mucicolens]
MESALAKINAQIQALQRRAESLRLNGRAAALQKIIRQMRDFQISPEDIQAAYAQKKAARRKRKTAQGKGDSRSVVAPKYRHPESGDTWSGRGRAPRWLAAAERAGASREHFLI